MRIAFSGLMILLALPLASAVAQQQQPPQQQQDDSMADAARRARDQKKDQAKPAKVWDNDNVPAADRSVNVVGQSNEAGGDAANQQAATDASAGSDSSKSEGKSPQDVAAALVELSSAKDKLQTLKADLDVLQRKYTLDAQTYQSNPNPPADKPGADALANEQAEIAAKQQEVEDQQKRVDELDAKLKESAPSSNPPSNNSN